MLVPGYVALIAAAALIIGLTAGAVLAWLMQRGPAAEAKLRLEESRSALTEREREVANARTQGDAELRRQGETIARLEEKLIAKETEFEIARVKFQETFDSLAAKALAANNEAFLTLARQELGTQQKDVATELERRQTALSNLLEPLKHQLQQFRGKVEEVYEKENNSRVALAEQVHNLASLNQQLSRDAENLTKALKGSSKAQGNWGELILERILETVGWREGHEYHLQESFKREDGSRGRPDVVVHLPDDRHIVIDAKVSLTAYQEYGCTEDEVLRGECLKRHLASVRSHIRELAARDYQKLHGLNSLDYVVIFVPIETAFMLAISNDVTLWEEAWEKNVLLVSPSTLLFMVRTVAHLWRQEDQSRNAKEIASRGADLYDKLVGFVEDVESVGNRLKQAGESYDRAYSKLATGNNNLIRQADKLRALGVKPTKSLTQRVLALAGSEEEQIE